MSSGIGYLIRILESMRKRVVDEFEMVHARFLAPQVKARGFGMTHLKISLRNYVIGAQVDALRRVPYSGCLQSETWFA
jgi:hypothetical protein